MREILRDQRETRRKRYDQGSQCFYDNNDVYIVTLLLQKTSEAIIIIMLFAILTALVNISLQLHDMLKRKAMDDDETMGFKAA